MAEKPESPGAGLWEYGTRTGRRIANMVRRIARKLVRNRATLIATFKMAKAIVELYVAIAELFRHS